MIRFGFMIALWVGMCLVGAAPALAWELNLPTGNRSIFSGDPSDFYMYTDRNFEGVKSQPWTAGQYGFVRDQKRTAAGVIMTKFHEGLDIKPVKRDERGIPLDLVYPISAGTVVHVATQANQSSYGKYVVIRHDWPEGPFYSLYAHLMEARVSPGARVGPQEVVGRLGYTGEGIDRVRAHLHVELNLLLSDRFESWHASRFQTPNHHGNYNGLNLVGLDLARLYKERLQDPALTVAAFLSRERVHHKIRVAARGKLPLLARYPFLLQRAESGRPVAWEIHFNQSGVPLAVHPSSVSTKDPVVTWVEPSKTYHAYLTRGRLSGSGSTATLSASGLSYLSLVTGQF
ncbi:MAG: Murein DD-endopeptidase MepM and murein hydrolase activator NlpD, containing LysM domain [Verrucomicrobia bacterium]|jgi:murein DD-endopeptidase MepM/ murein hydrolase activator NlpD|nr:MAG: Murein DD-endopeptidase MepM and murein hydrolase activator NlpD, containing LysM domain [Verrucomicrobiota bacterium]